MRALDALSNNELRHALLVCCSQERESLAALVAHIAEFDRRKLYAVDGYPSMFQYCRDVLRLSEGGAFRRIRAARAVRRFPQILEALAHGRLHLMAVVLLYPHLTLENCDELMLVATHKGKAEIERLLAHRYPKPDLPVRLRALPQPRACEPGSETLLTVPMATASPAPGSGMKESAAKAAALSPVSVSPVLPNPVRPDRITPLAPKRYGLQLTIDEETQNMLRHAQSLLSHTVASGDVAEVIKRALTALVERLEKNKFAACSSEREARATTSPRAIPARVKRAVWKRDKGCCTFVGENGHRCGSREFLEFDHVRPVAWGGEPTIEGIRLRCRAHNQLEAERVFGGGFMNAVREARASGSSGRSG